MTDDDIESMLAHDDDILPSSGFEVSVMEAVRQDAASPPPLAFPWGRALPCMFSLLAALGVTIWTWAGRSNTADALFDGALRELPGIGTRPAIQWVTIAVVATIMSVFLSLRLMRGRL
jgi:hypothetical protein